MATIFTKSSASPDLRQAVPQLVRQLIQDFGIVGWAYDAALSVTIPTIADAESDLVAVTVTGVAVGDVVMGVSPTEALPTDCIFSGAYVSAADTVTFAFDTKEGGSGVTGAAKTFAILIADRT